MPLLSVSQQPDYVDDLEEKDDFNPFRAPSVGPILRSTSSLARTPTKSATRPQRSAFSPVKMLQIQRFIDQNMRAALAQPLLPMTTFKTSLNIKLFTQEHPLNRELIGNYGLCGEQQSSRLQACNRLLAFRCQPWTPRIEMISLNAFVLEAGQRPALDR